MLNFGFPQEAAKESKAALLSPDDAEDAESPLPSNIIQPVRKKDKDKDKDSRHHIYHPKIIKSKNLLNHISPKTLNYLLVCCTLSAEATKQSNILTILKFLPSSISIKMSKVI